MKHRLNFSAAFWWFRGRLNLEIINLFEIDLNIKLVVNPLKFDISSVCYLLVPAMVVENITKDIANITLRLLDLRNLATIDFVVPVYGYLSHIVICLTVFANSFACVILLQTNMRSPINILFAGMAISDMCIGIFLLPIYIYFYSFGSYIEKVQIN